MCGCNRTDFLVNSTQSTSVKDDTIYLIEMLLLHLCSFLPLFLFGRVGWATVCDSVGAQAEGGLSELVSEISSRAFGLCAAGTRINHEPFPWRE